jgi:septal ring factor EnvC (AmiA/AmiB activator)
MASPALSVVHLALPLTLLLAVTAAAQPAAHGPDVAATLRAMAAAQREGAAARARAERLEAQAARVTEAADRTAQEEAATAARIQETEADIAQHQAQVRLIAGQRRQLRERLAERQEPLVRLTAALQRLSRRPPALALLRPGSLRDTMYMRALLGTIMPEVEQRTAELRAEIEQRRALERRARVAEGELRASEAQLVARRQALVTIETRQRLASRDATGIADRESERALALAEKARDLGALVQELGREGALRDERARRPGPSPRPARPEDSQVVATASAAPAAAAPRSYILPVTGRLVAGFEAAPNGQPRSQGIVLAPRGGAQVVAPAPGRVAFAGPFHGYGKIVIIEHDGGWTSLVTGLARLDAQVGQQLVAGSPLGIAAPHDPQVTVELRHDGEPVNPLQYVTSL